MSINYGARNFGKSDLNLGVELSDKEIFNRNYSKNLLDNVSIVAFGCGTWNMLDSHFFLFYILYLKQILNL